ncbi:MAG: toxin YoeB [Candidatus Melainabacteria bacterium GWF2_37_15]|nr:MAG: toxin YoeB [Candidatus Melainabacteria bacterium GWF2_37_15]
MKIKFTQKAKKQYEYWKEKDRKILVKINELIKDIQETPFEGLGKPEALKFNFNGYWLRRINYEHRLVYKVEDDSIVVVQCRYHY